MTPAQVAHIMALVEEYAQSLKWGDYPLSKAAKRRAIKAALRDAPQAEGWVMVPAEIVDRFPEISTSNYDHDDACALNAWGVELVLAARPSAPTAVEPRVIDKSELKRLVTQVFGEDFQIVRQAAVGPDERADMFWDHGDPERFGHDIDEIVQDYGPGEIVKIDQAKRLPTITVRVLPPKDEDSNLEYEVIDDHAASASKGTPL